MEGISHEVCSLAGTLGLGKLIGFYDHNGISIDGETEGWFTDDTAKRFEACHWHVIHEIDGHDPQAVKEAILEAQSVKDKPSLIICRTVIGFGSPNKAGKEEAHGAPLGEEEVALARQKLDVYKRQATQFAARLRMFIATGQPMNGLRLLLFIVNKQAALLVNKLDAQMAAFQQLPGRGRQATVRREMDLCAFAERMVRS